MALQIERIPTDGIAALSYIVGDKTESIVTSVRKVERAVAPAIGSEKPATPSSLFRSLVLIWINRSGRGGIDPFRNSLRVGLWQADNNFL